MNAAYSNRFNYDVNGSSSLKFRIVPIPPPAAAEDMRVAPNVTGLTYKQAVTLLERLDTAFVTVTDTGEPPDESEKVVDQHPAAGEIIPTGGGLEMHF